MEENFRQVVRTPVQQALPCAKRGSSKNETTSSIRLLGRVSSRTRTPNATLFVLFQDDTRHFQYKGDLQNCRF